MLLIGKQEIKNLFTMKEAIEADKEAYRLFSSGGCQVPLRTQVQAPKEEGVFLFMPAYAETLEVASLKNVNIFPKNGEKNLPTAPAQILLINGKTGIIDGILDGTYITSLRTGAASGAAFDELAVKNARIGALIGTGSQARDQLEAMLVTRDLEEIRVYARTKEKREQFVAEMEQEFQQYRTKIVGVTSSTEAVKDADVIVLVTSSKEPVISAQDVKKGATISCIGSYQPQMQELDPMILEKASKIYFDSKEAVLIESGDFIQPLEAGIIKEEDFTGDFGDYLLGKRKGRENDEEIIVFKSVGIGTQDLVTAKHVYDKALKQKVGTTWG